MTEPATPLIQDRPTVLLIDDEADVISSLRRILKLKGYESESASSIAEALERDDWDRFIAGVFDRNLPDGMIEEALPMIRQKAPDMAIIIATGYADLDGTIKAFQAGVEDYLIKPVNPDLLTNRLAKIEKEQRRQKQIQRLERDVLRTAEEEKRRISLEIHDGLASLLCGVNMLVRSLGGSLEKKGLEGERDQLAQIEEHLGEGIRQARTVAHQLCSIGDHPNDLSDALRKLAGKFESDHGHDCQCTWEGAVPVADPIVAHHLFRIAQEAVSNAMRHGEATRVDLTLKDHDNALELRIADNGKGFDGEVDVFATGFGLRSMLYRSNAMGARLTFESTTANRGATVLCIVPKASLHPDQMGLGEAFDEVG